MSVFASQIDATTVFVAIFIAFGGICLYLYKDQLKTKQNESASKCFDQHKPYNILQIFVLIVIGHLLFRLPSLMGYYNDTNSCQVCIQISVVASEVAKLLMCMEIMPIFTKYTNTHTIANKCIVSILIINMLSAVLHLRGTVDNGICLYQISNISNVTITCSWAVIGILNAFVVSVMYSNLNHSEKQNFKPWMICCVIFIFLTSITLCIGYYHLMHELFLILIWFAQFSCLYYEFYGFYVRHHDGENYENVKLDDEDIMSYEYDYIDSDDMDMHIIHSRVSNQRITKKIKRSVRSISNPTICIEVTEEQSVGTPTESEMLKRLRRSQMPSTDATISNTEESTDSTVYGNIYTHFDESNINYEFSHIDTSDDSHLLDVHGDDENETFQTNMQDSFKLTETTIGIGLDGTKDSQINTQIHSRDQNKTRNETIGYI